MLIGYARTSTLDQTAGFEAQLTELKQAGCEKVFSEQVSSVAPRAQLDAALEYIREGDVLVVSKLDRLARSTQHLLEIVEGEAQRCSPANHQSRYRHQHSDRKAAADDDRGYRPVRARNDAGASARGDRQGEERRQVQGTRADSTGESGTGAFAQGRGCGCDGDREATEDRESQRLSRTDGSRS